MNPSPVNIHTCPHCCNRFDRGPFMLHCRSLFCPWILCPYCGWDVDCRNNAAKPHRST